MILLSFFINTVSDDHRRLVKNIKAVPGLTVEAYASHEDNMGLLAPTAANVYTNVRPELAPYLSLHTLHDDSTLTHIVIARDTSTLFENLANLVGTIGTDEYQNGYMYIKEFDADVFVVGKHTLLRRDCDHVDVEDILSIYGDIDDTNVAISHIVQCDLIQ